EQANHSTVDVLQDPGDLLVGGSGQRVEHGWRSGSGRLKTPSSTSAWKWTLTLSAEPNLWIAVIAPHWPSAIPWRAGAQRRSAKTLRMNTCSAALVNWAAKAS